tara:strand:- start:2 stop:286 length:285 start_codon:yes stop_codon:yes gene_type:complete
MRSPQLTIAAQIMAVPGANGKTPTSSATAVSKLNQSVFDVKIFLLIGISSTSLRTARVFLQMLKARHGLIMLSGLLGPTVSTVPAGYVDGHQYE